MQRFHFSIFEYLVFLEPYVKEDIFSLRCRIKKIRCGFISGSTIPMILTSFVLGPSYLLAFGYAILPAMLIWSGLCSFLCFGCL